MLPGTSPAVDAVLARGLAKTPSERYDSCGAFVVALGSALGVPGSAATVPQAMSGESQLATVVSAPPLGSEALAAPASVKDTPPDSSRRVMLILVALLLLSAGGGIILFLRPTSPKVTEPEPTAAAALTTGASATASSGFSSIVNEPASAPTAAELTTSDSATVSSGISSKVDEFGADATGASLPHDGGPRAAAPNSLPFEEKPTETFRSAGGTKRAGAAPKANVRTRASVPKQSVFPPLLSGAAHSGDTQLGPAWDALDNARQPGGRLARENFVDAMGTARAVLQRRPTQEARFLDAFSRAGVAFADGRSAEAWQLLTRALDGAGPAANSRALRFVEDEVRALGPNPGPDANWVMGLAFADVRGDLTDELAKAEERAPRSPRLREARSLAEGR
ncbi:MAG: hypothetical protein ACXVH0_10025 [Thermoanaerobaculia bacterium]